ncbi:hypothetical protein JG688_00010295 [Phytophthora aleatoria]|uniref:MULE transposase domain-containing protein n=1 Tax=Phytophthora aleatoria TaxID=2496075 RepID=A0A8J5J274_9STRA|nr:hypothetical protein JG688_00010295 [Phytophthora aleatoria]
MSSALRKLERYATIADAIAVVETFAEQTQQRRVHVQQPKPHHKPAAVGVSEDDSPIITSPSSSNAVVLECENAPACKWFVRLSFVKGEKKWKISSMNTMHHKTKCSESRRTGAAGNATAHASSVATDQLLASANASAAAVLADTSGGEAATSMDASMYAGKVFTSWKEALGAIRALALHMGRRVMAEKVEEMIWCGKPVMARRVVCQNYRNSNCDWMVMLDEATDESERYTVLSMALLHSKECLETCNFIGSKKKVTTAATKGGSTTDPLGSTGSALPGSSLLVDDVSKYQLTHEMRWGTGKEATKAIADFALVVQRKRAKLCKRNNGGSNKKYVCSDEQCLWFVRLAKGWKSKSWKISAMNLKHSDTCTGVPKPTARQLAELRFFRQAVTTHSKASGTLLTDNFLMNSDAGIQIPRGMAYRAQKMVVATSTDDLTESYKFIPSLMESFLTKNPGSIANYEKDPQGHFIRAFIMPNASMAVLGNQQQVCGIHVHHYSTVSYQGCMALLVTRDGSLEYQVLAFALLPTSDLEHMKWFIALAKRGGARFDGNPVFCSHSEHGLLRALAQEARHAKIMFCVRSLLEEMARDKNIPALGPLEEQVWELQRQETEEAFLSVLGVLEGLNAAAAAFLRTGAEEAVAGSDIQRSDEAPFDLVYMFLAFLMDGNYKKSQVASKLLAVESQRPTLLTPGADAVYRQERQAAAEYTMFQLGWPCRHFIAASLHFANEVVLLDCFDLIYKATAYVEVHRSLRIEIPVAGDLHKDQSLLPAIRPRNTKQKKRPRSANGSSGSDSTTIETSTAIMSSVSSAMSVSNEDSSAPLAKTPRLEFDSDVVNSLGEIV